MKKELHPGSGCLRSQRTGLAALSPSRRVLLVVFVWAVFAAAFPAAAQTPAAADAKHYPIEAMQAVRLQSGERITLDGTLSHPAWQRAPVHSRFVSSQPLFDSPLPQVTRVQVLFDERALYVGVTALETRPNEIRAPVVRADQVNRTQDFVVVYIDAIGTKRSAQFFRVNAAGSMGDGLHTAADDSEDFSPDFDWDARVAPHPQGWTAVFRLPFASLRFAPGQHDWRIMVARRLPRTQFHLVASVPIPHGLPSFIHHLQPLLGVELPQDSQFITWRPSLTARREKPANASGANPAKTEMAASLDVKWRPRPEAVVDATLNPDFSQVALDVPQLAGNSRFALFYPEKRPFFFESADLLRSPTEAFYTRSYTEPRWGLRGTWRSPSWAGTTLALDDRGKGLVLLPGPYGTDFAEQPPSRVLAARARSDGATQQWGAVVAARQYSGGRGDNTVLGPDLAWQFTDSWRLRAQWLHSSTSALARPEGLAKGNAVAGDRVYARAYYNTHRTEANLGIDDLSPGFRHDSGFVNQVGVRKWHGWLSHGWPQVGPFNQFWINSEFERVTDGRTGALVSEYLRPGIWSTGASNLEWWAEYWGHSVLRTAALAPLLHENYVATGVVFTPARWFPLLDAKLELGKKADTAANEARPGGTFRLSAKLRPLARLEFEPSVSSAWLKHGGQRVYAETAAQALAVWHFDARHNLRVILERTTLDRRAESFADGRAPVRAQKSDGQTTSVTYTWRESAGSVLYVGASSSRQGPGSSGRDTEVFVKFQVDVDELRARLR
jgi:hypothetical protein